VLDAQILEGMLNLAQLISPDFRPGVSTHGWTGAWVYRVGDIVLICEGHCAESRGKRCDKEVLIQLASRLSTRFSDRFVRTVFLGTDIRGRRIYEQPFLKSWMRQAMDDGLDIENAERTLADQIIPDSEYQAFQLSFETALAELAIARPDLDISNDTPVKGHETRGISDVMLAPGGGWILSDPVYAKRNPTVKLGHPADSNAASALEQVLRSNRRA